MNSILEEIKALEGFGYGSNSLDLEITKNKKFKKL